MTIVKSSENKIDISGVLNFETVPEMTHQLKGIFNGGSNFTVDLSQIERSDSSGLAFLVELQRQAKNRNIQVNFENMPQAMQAIANVCGLFDVLEVENGSTKN